jgi:exodeoxyribonuclease VII small subunit
MVAPHEFNSGASVARDSKPRDSKPPEFEQSLQELERLVERLERGDLPLEEALKSFERGIELTRHCQSALRAAQQRVEILLRRNHGEAEPVPFQSEEEPVPEVPAALTEASAGMPDAPPAVPAPELKP